MPNEQSVTLWITAIRRGDSAAAEKLWDRYFRQLMAQARRRMKNVQRSTYDEEDVALSTFRILCEKLHQGQYPALSDREELWQLMLTVLIRKICRRVKYQHAAKRIDSNVLNHPQALVQDIPAHTSKQLSLEFHELISKLGDPNLEQVALLKFEGYTNDEVATKLNRTRRTIQRMLNLIRELWKEEVEFDEE